MPDISESIFPRLLANPEQFSDLLSMICKDALMTINKPEFSIAIAAVACGILATVAINIIFRKKSVKTKQVENHDVKPLINEAIKSEPLQVDTTKHTPIKTAETVVEPSKSAPQTPTKSELDVDGFIRKLLVNGFQVQRVKKNNIVKEQVLRINSKGVVSWSKGFFSKNQPITSLLSAFESDSSGFILEFKKKTLHLRMKSI
jgi:hypothetical protein